MDKVVFFAYTPLSKRIKLTSERLSHIVSVHPIMAGLTEKIKATLTNPEIIKRGARDTDVWLYYLSHGAVKGRYLVVVVKISNGEGFVITGYVADRIKAGDNIWQR